MPPDRATTVPSRGDDVPAAGAAERTRTIRELFTSPHAALAIGVLLLEFSAGLTVYVSAAVIPPVIAELQAAREYPLIVSATSVGLFASLAVAARLLRRVGPRPVLAVGLLTTVAGAAISAVAPSALVFAIGRLAASFGSGLLGVFGTAAVIAAVPQAYRIRLLALTSAMWILPGMVGPAGAVALLHAVGWRWTLLMALPVVLLARILVGRAGIRAQRGAAAGDEEHDRPLIPALLLPAGMAVFVFGSAGAMGPWALTGLAVAVVGTIALLPRGTARLHDGPPRHLALLAVVSFGYFGADSLLTAIGTRADHLPLMWVSIALGASAVCWSLTSMVQPRLSGSHGQRAGMVMASGTAVMALGTAAMVVLELAGAMTVPGLLLAWCAAGAGMGLAYPTLYLRATTATPGRPLGAGVLATAVLVAESTGSMLGAATGSAVVDGAQRLGAREALGLHASMVVFAAALVVAVAIAAAPARSHRTPARRRPGRDAGGRVSGAVT